MRNLKDWLESYQTFMFNTEPAALFDKWTGISLIAACLRKKVSLQFGRFRIYPNLYVVFVAEPGVARKTQAISYGVKFLSQIPEVTMCADATTKEALIEDLETCAVDEPMPSGDLFRHSSLSIISKEFESFLGQKKENTKMLVLLTDLFDCQELPWKYRTKHSGSNTIPSVFINLLGATTPESLASSLPSTAVGGGLTSRIFFVWAEKKKRKVPIPWQSEEEKKLAQKIVEDLARIARITGDYTFSLDCEKKWEEWYMAFEETDPKRLCRDPSFLGWYSRKPTMMLKMSMIMAASEGDSMILEWKHFDRARFMIEEVEGVMGNAFRAMGKSTVSSEVDTVISIIQNRGWINEKQLLSLIWRDTDSLKFDNVIMTALRTGKITRHYQGPKGEQGSVWYASYQAYQDWLVQKRVEAQKKEVKK